MKKSHVSKFIFSIIFFVLGFTVLFGNISFQESSQNVYAAGQITTIASADKLAQLAHEVNSGTSYENKIVYLTQDIDLSGKEWTPIGTTSNYSFKGTFDGRGFKITGLTITDAQQSSNFSYLGLFGYTNGAIIRNVTLDLINIDCSFGSYVGGLVGFAQNTQIYDCATYGNINCKATTGGIAGTIYAARDSLSCLVSSFSYAKVLSSGTSCGLIGSITNVNTKVEVNKCFFNGILASTDKYGISSNIDSAIITDCYSIGYGLYYGNPNNHLVTNNNNWITDTNNLMQQGSNTKVLKGVGNIYREHIEHIFNKDNGKYEIGKTTGELVKSTIYNDDSITSNSTFTSSANYTYTKILFTRETCGTSNSDINEIIHETCFATKNIEPTIGENKLKEEGTASFNISGKWEYNVDTCSVTVKNNVQGYYKITTYQRGQLKEITSSAKTYKDVTGTTFEHAPHLTMTIGKCAEDVDNTSINNTYINNTYNSLITSEQTGNETTFYRPYGEKYEVTFSENSDSEGYLSKLAGYRRANKDDDVTSFWKIDSNPVTEEVRDSANINYYFNNILQVTLLDGREKNDSLNAVGGSWETTYTNKEYKIGVMLYESVSNKGICYNGNAITEISLLSENSKNIYPLWSKFKCAGIGDSKYDYFVNSTSTSLDNRGYGAKLSSQDINWKADTLQWYPKWVAFNQGITVNYNEGVKSVQYKIGNADYKNITNKSTFPTNTGETGYSFQVIPNGGYELNNITLKTPKENLTFDTNNLGDYSYYGCDQTYGTNNNLKVKSTFRYKYESTTGEYIFTFTNLIGVSEITFDFKKVEYNAIIKTNIDSDVYKDRFPISLQGNGINTSTSYSVNFTIGDPITLGYSLKEGYELKNTCNTITKSGKNLEIEYKIVDDSNLEFTLNSIAFDVLRENDIEITLNITRKSTEFDFKLDRDIAGNEDAKGFSFTIDKQIENETSQNGGRINKIRDSICTDTVVTITFENLPYGIVLGEGDILISGLGNSSYTIEKISGADQTYQQFTISNIIIDTTQTVNVIISCEIPKINFTIQRLENNDNVSQENEISIPYNSKLEVTKAKESNTIVCNVITTEDTHTFEYVYNSNIVEKIELLFNEIKMSEYGINAEIKSVQHLTQTFLQKYTQNENVTFAINFVSKSINVHIGSTFVKNSSNVIGKIESNSGDNYSQFAGEYGTVSADKKVGFDFVGFYVVQKDSTGKVEGDNFVGKTNASTFPYAFKYSLGTSKTGYNTILIEKTDIYIVKVYRAKMFTAYFNTTIKDEITNQNLRVEPSPGEQHIEYNQKYSTNKLPTVQIYGMYEFGGWECGSTKINYASSAWTTSTFNFDANFTVDDNNNTVTFYLIANPVKITINLYKDSELFGTGSVHYASNEYSISGQPAKIGYTLAGWEYRYKEDDGTINQSKDGTTYVVIQNGEILTSSKKFDIQATSIDFVAVWEPNIINNIKFRAGGYNNEGQFVSGQKEYTATVVFGTSNYQSELFALSTFVPTWTTNYATYEFVYFIFNDNTNKIFDPNSSDESRRYILQESDLSSDMIFTAYYKVTDFVEPTVNADSNSWIYDAIGRSVYLNFNGKQNTNVLTYSYQWYKDGNVLPGQTAETLNNIKNVVDSGNYTCEVKVSVNNSYAFTQDKISKQTSSYNITISPKMLWFTQNGQRTDVLTKMYDNTNKTDASVSYDGVCSGDSIIMVATYDNVNVGTYISMTISLSTAGSTTDVRNYCTPNDVTGTITPYQINFVLKNSANNYIVKNGEDNLQINIKEYYTISSDNSAFMQKYGFTLEFTVKTSKNEVGEYKQNNPDGEKNILLTFNMKVGNNANFQASVVDSFYIKLSDENSITVSLKVLSNDKRLNEQVETNIAYLVVNSQVDASQDEEHIFNISGNRTSNVTIIERKDYFSRNPNVNIRLMINEQDINYGYIYWIEEWKVLVDGSLQTSTYEDNHNITYSVSNTSVKQIIINCYITTLSQVTYDYNLAQGETIENSITSTKFAYAKTIQYSINNYNSQFPTPVRKGFNFVSWNNGTTNVTNQTIWDKKYTKLTAIWELADITLDQENIDDSFTYDGSIHQYVFLVTNINTIAINYTYKWTSTASVVLETINSTLKVKNVANSGVYTMTIVATSGGVEKSVTRQVKVQVNPYDIIATPINISKQYDKSTQMTTMILQGVSGETVHISGNYYGYNAGALLDKTSLTYIVKLNNVTIDSIYNNNYYINIANIDEQSKITPKEIEITFVDQAKVYDKTPLSTNGVFTENPITFNYIITTAKVENDVYVKCSDAGEYTQQTQRLMIEISGDLISNFNITLNGTLTIKLKALSNSNVNWIGDREVIFDGKSHTLKVESEYEDAVQSYKFAKDGVTLASGNFPVTCGVYTVTAIFKQDCSYEINETIFSTLTIKQRTLNISYSEVTNGKIEKVYDGTNVVEKDISDFTIETIVTNFEPTIIYIYRSVTAGENIAIDFALDEQNENNKNYVLAFPNGIITGNISKKNIQVQIDGVTKQYDGKDKFVIPANLITVNGIVNNENLDGDVTFTAKEVNKYSNTQNPIDEIVNNLYIGGIIYSKNYEIESFQYDIEIIKAKLIIACSPRTPYTYIGKPIEIEYDLSRSDANNLASKPESLIKTYYIKNEGAIDYEPLQVGDYQIEFSLSALDQVSYEIISTQVKFDYSIVKRDLIIKFQKSFEYTGQVITYSANKISNNIYILSTDKADNTLGSGDSISWNFVTTDKNCGTYYIAQQEFVSPANITIYKGDEDYTNNYNIIIHTEAQIVITKNTIDRSKVQIKSDGGVYNAKVHIISFIVNGIEEEFNYKSIYRNEEYISGENNIKYAGEYSLEIELKNYNIVNNRPFTYTITPKDVDLTLKVISKIYDGTDLVENSDFEFKSDANLCEEDDGNIYVIGRYEDKNIGYKKKVKFSLQSVSNSILESYNLLTQIAYGDILPCEKTLSLSNGKYSVYYNGNYVVIEVSNFTSVELENREVVSGSITLNKKDVGQYELSEMSASDIDATNIKIVDAYSNNVDIDNYVISFAGIVEIKHAWVDVDVKNLSYVYNAKIQTPIFENSIYNNRGEIADDFEYEIQYIQNSTVVDPINAGKYSIKLILPENSNYRLTVQDGDNVLPLQEKNFGEIFSILQRKISIFVEQEVNKRYKTGVKATYNVVSQDIVDPTVEQDQGLLSIHQLVATLSTNSDEAKEYSVNFLPADSIYDITSEVYIKSLQITQTSTDVTANYEVTSLTCTIIISNIGEDFDIDAISNLIYDGTDKASSGEFYVSFLIDGNEVIFNLKDNNEYNGETVINDLKYKGTSTNKIIYAGEYSATLIITPNGFATITQPITFTVQRKELKQINYTSSKVYDATSEVVGNITSSDICYQDGTIDDVVISGAYYDEQNNPVQTVGEHLIKFALSGTDSDNYVINLIATGEITHRQIHLKVSDGFALTFNNETQTVDYSNLVITSGSLVSGDVMSGSITILQTNAGTYELNSNNIDISGLIVISSLIDVTENYQFIFDGNITINTKVVNVLVGAIRLKYNGQVQNIDKYLSFDSLEDELLETATLALFVTYDKEVCDAGDYIATVSSNTDNYLFNVVNYTDNKIPFSIAKQTVVFSLGEYPIEKVYNPTSDHKSKFEPSFVSGLIEGHELKGEYRLSKVGLGVGTYTQDENENGYVIFENLEIIAKGENVLDKNYKVLNKIGSIKIVPFEITRGNAYLVEKEIVYSKQEVLDQITFAYFDANKNLQTISTSNTTWGTISLVEESAINVGTYHVKVSVNNSTLASGDEFEFNIVPFEITQIDFVSDKEYDATSDVINSSNNNILSSMQVFDGDNVQIVGHYVDANNIAMKNVSENEYNISFAIKDSDNFPAKNYTLSLDEKGRILPRNVTLLTNKNLTYKSSGEYAIPYNNENFTISSGSIVATQTLEGVVRFTKLDYLGNIDLTSIDLTGLTVIDAENINQTSNYMFTLDGNVNIETAKISVDFSGIDNSYIYNNSIVVINPIISLVDANGDTLPNLIVNYKSSGYDSENAPKNVGNYVFSVKLNSSFYEFSTLNTFNFEITVCDFVVAQGVIPSDRFYKNFGDIDPELIFTTLTQYDETINLYFTRESGESVGYYDIQLVNWDNKNYNVTLENGSNLFRIKKAGITSVTILATDKNIALLQKQYDARNIDSVDISILDYNAGGEVLTGTITFEVGINVGNYQVESWQLESENYENFNLTSEVDYVISPKDIKLQGSNLTKPYDNSTKFYGNIEILDNNNSVLDANIYHLSAYGVYENKIVSENVAIIVNFSGEDITNYNVTNSLTGKISKRNVKVIPRQGQEIVYGTQDYEILYELQDLETNSFEGSLESEISGNLYIDYFDGKTKFIVGQYPIKSNITSQNFEITFDDSVLFTITQRQLTITNSNNFVKVFDATSDVLGDFVIESGLISGDVVIVSAKYYNNNLVEDASVSLDKIVIFSLSGEDGQNYYAGNVKGSITNKVVKLKFVYYLAKDNMINTSLITDNEIPSFDLIYDLKIGDSQSFMPQPKHEGYSFVGWYLDQDYTSQIDLNTTIDSSIWDVNEDEKFAYAKWQIKTFEVKIVNVTKVNEVYTDDISLQGGTSTDITGLYEYYSIVDLSNKSQAKTGYLFIGYSDDINASVNEQFVTEGYTVQAKQNIIYAKFDPKTVKLTLFANEGVFTKTQKWTFDGTYTSATVEIYFNSKLSTYGISLPPVTREGYSNTGWEDSNGISVNFGTETILDENYFPERILYASWEANNYKLVLDANGGYYADFDTDIWTVVEQDSSNRATKVQKTIVFDQQIGELITPTRKGWTFDCYTNFVTEDLMFRQLNDISAEAMYNENTYTLTINSQHHNISIEVRNKDDILLNNYTFVPGDVMTASVSTTDKAIITATNNMGYTFKNWTSTYALDDYTLSSITIYEFLQDETLTANYDFVDNTITIKSNDDQKGYVYSGSVTTQGSGIATLTAKTESEVLLCAVALEGYEVSSWEIQSNGITCTLSGSDTDLNRTLSNFICDITVTVNFAPKLLAITIVANEEKGLISIDNVVDNVPSYTYLINTDSTLVFKVKTNHGYSVDTNKNNWSFDTVSAYKGEFDIQETNGNYTISFSKFYNDGTITIPFTTNNYTLKVVAVYRNDTDFTKDFDATNLVTITPNGQSSVVLNSNETFNASYLTQIKLAPRFDVKEGYSFSCWSRSGSSEFSLSAVDGLTQVYDDQSIEIELLDNLTIYLIYTINTYTIQFTVNDYEKGNIVYDNGLPQTSFAITVKYGYNTKNIVAVSNEYFMFVKWVKVVDGNNQDYSTNDTFSITDVKEDMIFMAVFNGQPISISVKLILPTEEMLSPVTDFGRILVTETSNTSLVSSHKVDNIVTYIISSVAGDNVTLNLMEENGYVFSSITPYYNFDSISRSILISNIFTSTEIEIYLKAKLNIVKIQIIGDSQGATIYENFNDCIGVESSRDLGGRHSYEFSVRSGGKVSAILNILPGFKLIDNTYFSIPVITEDKRTSISTGTINDIYTDMVIQVEIVANIYSVTFDFNYENCPESVTSQVKAGDYLFSPELPSSVTNPTRAKYRFVGWGLKNDDIELTYFFENNKIYYYNYSSTGKTKVCGFAGSEYAEISTIAGVDYDCTLYGIWEIITYKVNLVLVPSSTASKIIYSEVFPNIEGRKIIYKTESGLEVIGIEYVPGSLVTIEAPYGNEGYNYYGWSYEDGIRDRNLLNEGNFVQIMPEGNITVYLYYLLEVKVKTYGNGTVTQSQNMVLCGESVTVNATANDGYLFGFWAINGTKIENSTAQMNIDIYQPSTIFAKFIGKEVDVRLVQVNNATLTIASSVQDIEGEFRVGDLINFAVTNVTYGYYQKGYSGEYSNSMNGNSYRISKDDANRGYVEFRLVIAPKQVVVEYIISSGIGGEFVFDNMEVITVQKTYDYDSNITFDIKTAQRYELEELTLNSINLNTDVRQLKLNQDNGFDADNKNTIKATFKQLLWTQVYEMFAGFGSQHDPYVIYNEKQLAAMAYLINNNVVSETTVPYAQGYYVLKVDMYLGERFWQPIGTMENPFDGTFDFTDNNVIDLTLDKYYAVTNYDGLFGYLTDNARILRTRSNYTLAISMIVGISLVLIMIIVVLLLWIRHKKKKMNKLAVVSTIAQTSNLSNSVQKDIKQSKKHQRKKK